MHMYESSEALVKELENAIQQEQNESRKTQYQTILQTQRNISANLKSLGDVNSQNNPQNQTQAQSQAQAQSQQGTQAYNTESATDQYTSQAQQQAKMEAEQEQKKKK